MQNVLKNLHNIRITSTEDTVYHYCSWSSYYAIIENQTMRFCALPYMNDPLELEYGIDFIKQSISEYFEIFPNSINAEDQLFIKKYFDKDFSQRFSRVYIFCMSDIGDRLAMWRAYGADGEGCAIGFSKKHLLDLPSDSVDMSFFLTPLIYKKHHLDQIYEYIFGKLESLTKSSDNDTGARVGIAKYSKFFDQMTMIPLILKNFEYVEEVEWRLILHVGKQLWQSSSSPEILINGRPTVEVPLEMLVGGKRQIHKVVMGPSNVKDNAQKDSILRKSNQHRFSIGDLIESSIRYRNRNYNFDRNNY